MREDARKKNPIHQDGSRVPMGSVVAIRLSLPEKDGSPEKFTPMYAGPWMAMEDGPKGITYKVRDAVTREERQVTRTQFKLSDIPDDATAEPTLPRLRVPDVRTTEGNTWSEADADREATRTARNRTWNMPPVPPSTDCVLLPPGERDWPKRDVKSNSAGRKARGPVAYSTGSGCYAGARHGRLK
ncbi:hypothetical protein CSUI_008312 [Cystoisospora suis]|uniref:Uncharacterized protein n=1 Tax=Cystoisospora suis TaxID=483139 RepID=A0A2C6KA42_9APIC|nr:hypothetical protein CSUI_008312 [Cystoisospora suis]